MISLRHRQCLLHFIGIFLFLQLPGLALAQAHKVESFKKKPGSAWSQSDHHLSLSRKNTLKVTAEKLDDCTSKGRFANLDAVPDGCNAAYFGAIEVLNGHDEMDLPAFLQHGCAKWREAVMATQNSQDCRELGTRWWHLQEAVDRATVANGVASQRGKTIALGDAATDYVAKVNPMEVSEEIKFLQQLNSALEKPHPNPRFVFMAGTFKAELTSWLLHHCPTELAWGLPPKTYATASAACSALEPELRRFELNVVKLIASDEKATAE